MKWNSIRNWNQLRTFLWHQQLEDSGKLNRIEWKDREHTMRLREMRRKTWENRKNVIDALSVHVFQFFFSLEKQFNLFTLRKDDIQTVRTKKWTWMFLNEKQPDRYKSIIQNSLEMDISY